MIFMICSFCLAMFINIFTLLIVPIGLYFWLTLPIANISTLETFLEIFFVLFIILRKIWENTGRIFVIILGIIFAVAGFITVLVAYEAFRYGIDSPRFVYTLVDGIPILDSIENGIIQLWFWIYSFFNKIVQAINNFVGGI